MNDVLQVADLTVRFGPTTALDGVSLTLRGGEVHGLLGHNGSGKSTLIKTLAGVNIPEAGTVTSNGTELALPVSPTAARSSGLAFVHQGLGLAEDLSVLENIAVVGFDVGTLGRIRWGDEARAARAELARFGVTVRLDTLVRDLPPVEKAIVAIVRALASVEGPPGGRLLVLDEPTVYLPRDQVQRLFDAVREFVAGGDAVLFVSHRIDEVLSLTDTISVLRSGRLVATEPTHALDERRIVALIVGRELAAAAPDTHHATGEVAATFGDVTGAVLHGISFTVARGEILGVTGLAGSGFDELPYVLAGARPGSGTVVVGGRTVDVAGLDPRAAIAAGIVLIPADRARLGVIGEVSIRENVALPRMRRFFRGGLLREGEERDWVRRLVDGSGVLHGGVDREMNTLSGGNQQKTVLAKWLAGDPDLILLHEPTQGVDVGGRLDIHRRLREAADRGAAVVAAGESPEELAELCDRVLIVKDGVLFGELRGARVDKHTIVDATLSETPLPL
ncbi:sugar ABC transporter ATP-binding protein [Pseudonocardia sp.]|uniref:sugar ABC transporter ATP-binding protein n=1 Tax=Pseudonocardia sp. TaxID=60912 RepID=UPI003D0CA645